MADDLPPAAPRKGVAVVLAVLLGMLGAHLFYLGLRKQGWQYLGATLLCVVLIIALLSAFPTTSLGAGLFVLFLICAGIIGVATVYAHALWDAVRILLNGPDSIG